MVGELGNAMTIPTVRLGFADATDFYRIAASPKLDPERRVKHGQYMTPAPISRFMAGLFSNLSGDLRVLDPGAGVGSLTSAFVERLCQSSTRPRSVSLTCYEVEPLLVEYLQRTLKEAELQLEKAGIPGSSYVYADDFIGKHPVGLQRDFFQERPVGAEEFTHVIMNPPYGKIHSDSEQRAAFRKAGIETSNLYTGFMFLASQRLREGGEMVAIVPRSFCNGPYFKPFRKQFFDAMGLQGVHVFGKRDAAFDADDILQENVIIHAVKGAKPSKVRITSSGGGDFALDRISNEYVTVDMAQLEVSYDSVIRPDDSNRFVRIITSGNDQHILNRMALLTGTLAELGLEVSTGPVVDFRVKPFLRTQPEDGTVPLLYPTHFQEAELDWPKDTKKPNAIRVTAATRKYLWLNQGSFVVTRRFSSKEERRRIMASVYDADLGGELVGFENHLNVFHAKQHGFSELLAAGLCAYLNSSLVDRYFRQFNGHTQVNATDLRFLTYPDRRWLERIGEASVGKQLSQQEIDDIIESELEGMTTEGDPVAAQKKVEEALEILKALGLPRGQQNERSAFTLLALLDLKPYGNWNDVGRPLMGITPIMEHCREHYGRDYAPNTRETFRRQTIHQFVQAGIALYNPDNPGRPVNSPATCYQISREASCAIKRFGTDQWEQSLESFRRQQEPLVERWARRRGMQMIPVRVAEGEEIALSPGEHSELIQQVITEFAPRFTPGAEVIYVRDTGDKIGFFRRPRLLELGVEVDEHGKMPDVVLFSESSNWLVLVESVTSHGPVDAKRHDELAELFKDSEPGLVYVTAFPGRNVMARYLGRISWETEVWCADTPEHLIHFDGERFLGPYQG
jgi:adenine-specific DNA-methyltransferase